MNDYGDRSITESVMRYIVYLIFFNLITFAVNFTQLWFLRDLKPKQGGTTKSWTLSIQINSLQNYAIEMWNNLIMSSSWFNKYKLQQSVERRATVVIAHFSFNRKQLCAKEAMRIKWTNHHVGINPWLIHD